MQIKNEAILTRLTEVKQLRDAVKKFVQEEQKNCTHVDIGEAEGTYHQRTYEEYYDKTKRVCLYCGKVEEQPHGYNQWKTLTNSLVYKLTQAQLKSLTINVDWI